MVLIRLGRLLVGTRCHDIIGEASGTFTKLQRRVLEECYAAATRDESRHDAMAAGLGSASWQAGQPLPHELHHPLAVDARDQPSHGARARRGEHGMQAALGALVAPVHAQRVVVALE
jgi:hypothetical protein